VKLVNGPLDHLKHEEEHISNGPGVYTYQMALEVHTFQMALEVHTFQMALEVHIFQISLEVHTFQMSLEVHTKHQVYHWSIKLSIKSTTEE
jgi:hypothetical protein